MTCRGCGEDKKLIKAHIIPEAFFRGLRSGDTPPRLITDIKGVYPRKAPIGVYDTKILCRDCEDVFGDLDNYGQAVLLQSSDSTKELKRGVELLGYVIPDVNLDYFRKFLISVLWRASVSTHDYYSKVKLGPYEKRAKAIVWADGANINPSGFSFVVSKFVDDRFSKTMLDPHPERWYGINYYRIYMFWYTVHIKVDKRATPSMFKSFEQSGRGKLFVIARDMTDSRELSAIISIAGKAVS
ncbi:hypothetical protein QPM17_11415 [Marinobacter sp. TBZ242]|uniref:HNH endonuclease n=1 Tax=Marinobacter azerbaijanicus TaxID=3050455 RepID=A0ABT7IC54_9GAMM|nr:hypothetical protein [Marinobacter sp. TBZ242]MDL0431741.1 hypothetical protein [Marinobacter sp. TBZ242]